MQKISVCSIGICICIYACMVCGQMIDVDVYYNVRWLNPYIIRWARLAMTNTSAARAAFMSAYAAIRQRKEQIYKFRRNHYTHTHTRARAHAHKHSVDFRCRCRYLLRSNWTRNGAESTAGGFRGWKYSHTSPSSRREDDVFQLVVCI